MKASITRVLAMACFFTAGGLTSFAEDYQCQDSGGCSAVILEDGKEREVTFRKGDLVSTDSGWVVSPDDGWVKVRATPTGF